MPLNKETKPNICLMTYQPSWVIQYQSHPSRRIVDGKIRGFNIFPKVISPKVNVIARLEFEHVYFKAAVQQFSLYAPETLRGYQNIAILLTHSCKRCTVFVIAFSNVSSVKMLFGTQVVIHFLVGPRILRHSHII